MPRHGRSSSADRPRTDDRPSAFSHNYLPVKVSGDDFQYPGRISVGRLRYALWVADDDGSHYPAALRYAYFPHEFWTPHVCCKTYPAGSQTTRCGSEYEVAGKEGAVHIERQVVTGTDDVNQAWAL